MKKELNVEIDIENPKYLVSKYNKDTLAPELKKFLLNEIAGYDINKKVNITIKTKFEVSEEESDRYKKLIKKEFKDTITELKAEAISSRVKKTILFITGCMFIIIAYFFEHITGDIVGEIFTIFGWVAIWEVAYMIFFTDPVERRKFKRHEQILNAKIKFE